MWRYYNGYSSETLPAKPYFFNEKSGKQERETGTNFVSLSQSRNMIGRFMAT